MLGDCRLFSSKGLKNNVALHLPGMALLSKKREIEIVAQGLPYLRDFIILSLFRKTLLNQ